MRKAEAGRDVVVHFELESDGVAAFGRQAIVFLNHVAVGTAVPEKNGGTRRGLRQVIHSAPTLTPFGANPGTILRP
jgi:hypothetical protein